MTACTAIRARRRLSRPSFTLIELLVVSSIIAILASAVLFAMYGVVEEAKAARTRAQVAKLHTLIMSRWEGYATRVLRATFPTGLPVTPEPFTDTNNSGKWESPEPYTDVRRSSSIPPNGRYDTGIARVRLEMLRDLLRMELPDRKTDVTDAPTTILPSFSPSSIPQPAKWKSYRRRVSAATGLSSPWRNMGPDGGWGVAGVDDDGANGTDDIGEFGTAGSDDIGWSESYQGAECLYMIVASIRDGESNGLDFFKETEIGDIDGDNMKEILDAWGNPIEFLRWAPGYATLPGPDGRWGVANTDDDNDTFVDEFDERGWPWSDDESELQTRDGIASPDPFDPLKTDVRPTFRLMPLIFSAGPDRIYDIITDDRPPLAYDSTVSPADPFTILSGGTQLGQPVDVGGDSEFNDQDNITNHLIETD